MLAVEGLQQGQHVLGGLAVQVTGGLVADQQHRVADDGPRDGHPLLLAAGQLGRLVRRTVGQAHQLQRDGRALPALAGRQLGQQQRQLDILLRRQRRHQVVELEHEADLGRPPFGQGRTRELVDALTAHGDGTAAGRVQPTHQIEQRGLARARGPHQRQELALLHVQVDVVQHLHRLLAPGVDLGQVADFDQSAHAHSLFTTLEPSFSSAGGATTTVSPAFRPSVTSLNLLPSKLPSWTLRF
mmetsp:Transcript_67299/g.186139  ORF Transcript_67299/g.186139 Transcript_67299/m.186139 type:complete len:242 (-) Transcript_67299:1016-1741(-)